MFCRYMFLRASLLQGDGISGTHRGAESATQAEVIINLCDVIVVHREGIHQANIYTVFASSALIGAYYGQESAWSDD